MTFNGPIGFPDAGLLLDNGEYLPEGAFHGRTFRN